MARKKGSKNKKDLKNYLLIDNLPEVMEVVKKEIEDKRLNPSMILEEDSGLVFVNGEPHKIIDNQYVKNDEADIILQTRRVVRDYLILQDMKNK